MNNPFLPPLLLLLFIVFGASTFQGMAGFGMAIIAVPLLITLVAKAGVPIVTLASLSTITMVTWTYRKEIDWPRTLWIGVPCMLTVPVGAWLLGVLPIDYFKAGVGVLLAALSARQVWLRFRGKDQTADDQPIPHEDGAETDALFETLDDPHPFSIGTCVGIGLLSGIVGGATSMIGILMAAYLIHSGIARGAFKGSLNAIFLATAIWRLINYVYFGILTPDVLGMGLLALPVAYLGTRIGVSMDKFIPAKKFTGLIHIFLLIFGLYLGLGGVIFGN